MNFEELAFEYEEKFGEFVPILTTLDTNNEEYLKEIKKAIDNNEPIDRNYLAKIFMPDDELLY